MKQITSLLFILAFISTGCVLTPRWVAHEDIKVYMPPGFTYNTEEDGSMMISMAETSAFVSIKKVSNDQVFHTKTNQAIKLAQKAYGEDCVKVSQIAVLGKLKGQGATITTTVQFNQDSKVDETWFLTDEPKVWMISAGCSSGSSGVWKAYEQILKSLTLK